VTVHVEGSGVDDIDQLRIGGSGAFDAPTQTTPSQPRRQPLPLDVALTFPRGVAGLEHVTAVGLRNLNAVGAGSADVTIVDGKHAATTLTLAAASTVGDGGSDGDVDMSQPAVAIVSPSATAYTNGTLSVQVAVAGAADDVQLLVDGTLLASLTPPYQFDWNTTGQAEGSYMLTARATIAGASVDSAPRTVVVDRTPPTVTDRAPAPNATNVEWAKPVVAQFSEPLAPTTVNDSTVSVTAASMAVAKTLMLSSDGMTLTVAPTQPSLPAMMTVAFGTGITDRAGNALVMPGVPWTWAVPFWQQLGGPIVTANAINAHVQSDASGGVSVAYTYAPTQDTKYLISRWDDTAATWSTLGTSISDAIGVIGINPTQPEYTVAKDGTPWAFCNAFDSGTSTTRRYAAHWTGTAWSALPSVDDDNGVDTNTVDGSGAPVLVNLFNTSVTAQRFAGGAWAALGAAVPVTTSGALPVVRTDGTGAPAVAFADNASKGVSVYRYDAASSTWKQVASNLTANNQTVVSTSLAYARTGTIGVVAFRQNNTSNQINMVARLTDTAAVQSPNVISTGGIPTVAVSNSNEMVLASSDGTNLTVVHRTDFSAGTAWAAFGPAVNGTNPPYDDTATSMAVDPSNRLLVTFGTTSQNQLFVMRSNTPLP
jgi:hypothetical protein